MAVIWEKTLAGKHYQVRTAGRSVRLYTDGVFHTQYNPGHLLSGGVWDLLALPALLYPPHSIKRVLVLGLGGGAVIHLLRALLDPEVIIGVELDPVHIRLMKRFFSIKGRGIELVQDDAKNFIGNYQGEPFDLIVDDLFFEQNGEPVRAIEMDKRWLSSLRRCLSRRGMLVANFCDYKEFTMAAYQPFQWRSIFCLTIPTYENAVGAFLRRDCLMVDIEGPLRRLAFENDKISLDRLRFEMNQFSRAD